MNGSRGGAAWSGKRRQDFRKRSVADTPVMTELWFEPILAPTRTRNWANDRLDYVTLTEHGDYHHVNPSGKQIQGFRSWLKKEGFRKPCSGRYSFTTRVAVTLTSTHVVRQPHTLKLRRTSRRAGVEADGALGGRQRAKDEG